MAEPGSPPVARGAAWARLADRSAAQGRRGPALVAARVALAVLDRAGEGEEGLAAARDRVAALTGPDVVPLHVDMAGADAGGGPGAAPAQEARAAWLGAPADPVLAMVGLLERDGALDVVRVVVPGTGRGRRAFRLLLAALPPEVDVEMVLPARDPALVRACTRAGFAVLDGSLSARGHLGGSLRVRRAGRPPVGPAGAAGGAR